MDVQPTEGTSSQTTQTQSTLHELVLQLLECPVCYFYLQPPFGQCVQGHIICASCNNRLDRCPICRGRKPLRCSYQLEDMWKLVPIPCRYQQHGCQLMVKGMDLKNHEKNCNYAPWMCPLYLMSDCEWEGKKEDVVQHLMDEHSQYIICNESKDFVCQNVFNRFNNQMLMMVMLYTDNTLFRACWQLDNDTQLIKFAVSLLDSSKKDKFYYSLSLLSANTGEELVKMIAECLVPDDVNEMFHDNNYLAFHSNMLKRNVNEMGDVNYKISILKKTV